MNARFVIVRRKNLPGSGAASALGCEIDTLRFSPMEGDALSSPVRHGGHGGPPSTTAVSFRRRNPS